MRNLNRLANTKNPFQGNRKKVLAVCSAGLLRSPTIAWILSNPPFDYNTRAAGAAGEYALIPITEELVYWADEIVCVEEWQTKVVKDMIEHLGLPDKLLNVHVVETPDSYQTRDPELIALLTPKLKELFNV